jgi:uncharacterized protein (DUF1697 family)
MTVYIILFRGVGGATQLPTKPLREALTAAGFKDVATYINSGNAVLSSRKGAASVTADIAKITKKEFGFDKAIHTVTRQEWAMLIANNPFPRAVDVPKFLHAAVLAGTPEKAKVDALREYPASTSRSSARSPTCTRPTASARRSWRKNSTRASACPTRHATGTR